MAGFKYRYTYRPRRGRPQRREWWLAFPLGLLLAAVVLGLALTDRGGAGESGATACQPQPACAATPAAGGAQAAGASAQGADAGPRDDSGPPSVTGKALVVVEEPCGAVLHAVSAHGRLPPASLTKMMTALVAAERAGLSDLVTPRVSGAELAVETASTVMGLEPGQTVSVKDLLYGLLLASGNDAAIALAEHVGGTVPGFVAMMNDKASALGLLDTHFTNPHGLDDPELYTSAYDMAEVARELLRRPELAAIVGTKSYQPAWAGPEVWNLNELVYTYPGAYGVKIGYTDEALQTIVAAAEQDGRRIIVSVLGSADIFSDAAALLDWAFQSTSPGCATPVAGADAAAAPAGVGR